MNKLNIKRLCFDAVLAALTVILYNFVKISSPAIFPSFLDINISMIPVIICAFMFGPWDAAGIVIIRCLLKWAIVGSGTGYVGEVADLLIGLGTVIPAGLIYHNTGLKHKTLIAFLTAILSWVLMGVISNIFINIPWYNNFYFKSNYYKEGVHPVLVNMVNAAVHNITFHNVTVTKDNFMVNYIIFAIIPFNLLLSSVVVGVTVLVHGRLKVLYDYIDEENEEDEQKLTEEEIAEMAINEYDEKNLFKKGLLMGILTGIVGFIMGLFKKKSYKKGASLGFVIHFFILCLIFLILYLAIWK